MTVKDAVTKAIALCNEVFEYGISDVRLEEVERRGAMWAVTLSFIRPTGLTMPTGRPVVPARAREYKIFQIEEDGSLQSVKMRTA